jgi:hypothetical protein
MGPAEMEIVSRLVDGVLTQVEIRDESRYRLTDSLKDDTTARVRELCAKFPMW